MLVMGNLVVARVTHVKVPKSVDVTNMLVQIVLTLELEWTPRAGNGFGLVTMRVSHVTSHASFGNLLVTQRTLLLRLAPVDFPFFIF